MARAGELAADLDVEAAALVLTLHRAASTVVYDLEASVHRPSGWSWAGFRLLFVLWIAGPLLAKDAARIAGMSRQAISSLANTLERDGLVSRTRDGADGRAVALALTAQGRSAIATTYRQHNSCQRLWADRLTPQERTVLVCALGKLLDASAEMDVRRRD